MHLQARTVGLLSVLHPLLLSKDVADFSHDFAVYVLAQETPQNGLAGIDSASLNGRSGSVTLSVIKAL